MLQIAQCAGSTSRSCPKVKGPGAWFAHKLQVKRRLARGSKCVRRDPHQAQCDAFTPEELSSPGTRRSDAARLRFLRYAHLEPEELESAGKHLRSLSLGLSDE